VTQYFSVKYSIAEVSHWVAAQGRGVKVIKPTELKNLVLELVKGTLENYANQ